MNNIPQIGMQGIYTLLTPFDTLLLPKVAYRCAAVRRLEDIVAAGGDPQADYYTARGLDTATYQTDLAAGVCIVSLRAGNGSWVYVPTSYIASMPDQGGIPYTTLALAIKLAAIPDSLDLSYVKSKIQAVVKDNLGVDSTVRTVVISPTTFLSQTEHDTIEAARQANITNSTTDYAQLQQVTQERDTALQKVSELEAYIVSTMPAA